MKRRIIHLLAGLIFCLLTGATFIVCLFFYFGRNLPDYEYLRDYEPMVLNRMYTAEGEILHEYAREKRIFIPLYAIPSQVVGAFLAAEDKNFYYHFGLDVRGIFRAIVSNTLTQRWQDHPEGASTITQQLAKIFLLSSERSIMRKIQEAILAIHLEYALPKNRILELYLNQIYLGCGAYGVAAASLVYFDKDLKDLTPEEVAFLAALPKAPTGLIKGNLERLKERRNWVLDQMVASRYLAPLEAQQAKEKPIVLKNHQFHVIHAPYFVDEVKRQIIQLIPPEQHRNGGVSIKVTIDPYLQKVAEDVLRQGLINYDRRQRWRGPVNHIQWQGSNWLAALKNVAKPLGLGDWTYGVILKVMKDKAIIGLISGDTGDILWNHAWGAKKTHQMAEILKQGDVVVVSSLEKGGYQLEQIPEVSGGIIVIEPQSGRILAMSGGYDYEINQFNCATQARRQPGSVFKPFVYLTALEEGLTSDSLILDTPIAIPLGGRNKVYRPQNYTRQFYGLCPLHVGLEQSRNVMTIRLAQKIGMARIATIAKEFGIYSKLSDQLAFALGAGETTLLKLTAAYAMIANGGYKIIPRVVDSIQDRYGNILYQARHLDQRIASPRVIHDILSMLQGVIVRGTGRALRSLNLDLGGKTGTTNNFKDAWFVGFTPDLAVGVFVGHLLPQSLGNGESGTKVALPIFRQFMKQAYKKRPKVTFSSPVSDIDDADTSTTRLDLMSDLSLSEEQLTHISLKTEYLALDQ
jgi:penicillin-binding protein 1A